MEKLAPAKEGQKLGTFPPGYKYPIPIGLGTGASFVDLSHTHPPTATPPLLSTENPFFSPNQLITALDRMPVGIFTALHRTDSIHNAAVLTAAPKYIHAPSAAMTNTMLKPASMEHDSNNLILSCIVTTLIADAWKATLKTADSFLEFSNVPYSICHSFDMGTASAIPFKTFIPPNHSSANLHPTAIIDNIYHQQNIANT
ncbi:hypothetical protein CVT24_011788 [Panaeolus cyanescens]|uniref:Uncharacterized protein n=1 Tax=Panaeolus cyanescens TaxID=181874 RepID=A0A409X2Y2_9AGAR|nr:hypothetical protein CVT24_011788 [Panaeolus cyanescens]